MNRAHQETKDRKEPVSVAKRAGGPRTVWDRTMPQPWVCDWLAGPFLETRTETPILPKPSFS